MLAQTHITPGTANDFAGDLAPFAEPLGSPAGAEALGEVAALLECPRLDDPAALGRFLGAYRDHVLAPVELPAILKAHQHASRFETRELVAFDQQLSLQPLLKPFTIASLNAGRHQLRRLRSLRDQRLVQRYLAAVESGEAGGWHTLVYGLTLAVYSLPLRQGLIGYAQHTPAGFANAAGRRLKLSESELSKLIDAATVPVPAAVEATLSNRAGEFSLRAVA